ncbi:ATP-grasp domain-containing protein [Paenibacillus xanthanilyticus]|uniref:ATP-grasp domain-containing protein n=1 Tax=Paenibacillus xanthanilyticus TaxID=1783531 RepID=A0ABV8K660_9BACL
MYDGPCATVAAGTFDAEGFWRDPNASQLPFVPDKERAFIASAMDELLFPLCGEGGTLLTRFGFHEAQHDYLRRLGFRFETNHAPLAPNVYRGDASPNLFELALTEEAAPVVERLLANGSDLSAYAVIPHCDRFAQRHGLRTAMPDYEIVRHVNSKIYSNALYERLGLQTPGTVAYGAEQLASIGERMLDNGPFLIKDPYGVSGKGNMLITTAPLLRRVVKHVSSQERQGRVTCLLLEPFLQKEQDFSCQFAIGADGEWTLVSVQLMRNDGLAYLGSVTADRAFLDRMESIGYFDLMERTGRELSKDGYYGSVCIDSMLLASGELVPIVEVNARQSMGFINAALDRHLAAMGLQGGLTFLSVGYERELDYAGWLAELDEAALLFMPGRECGILPISANALSLASRIVGEAEPESTGRLFKGRCYVSVAARDHEERARLLARFREHLLARRFAIYN